MLFVKASPTLRRDHVDYLAVSKAQNSFATTFESFCACLYEEDHTRDLQECVNRHREKNPIMLDLLYAAKVLFCHDSYTAGVMKQIYGGKVVFSFEELFGYRSTRNFQDLYGMISWVKETTDSILSDEGFFAIQAFRSMNGKFSFINIFFR